MAQPTSPSTAVGKTDSSRNALKRGIFSNSLIQGEDPEAVEVIVDDVIKSFDVKDASGEIFARRLVQTTIQTKRLMQAQIDHVEGYMQSEGARQEFCRQVGIFPTESRNLPAWFFTTQQEPREDAKHYLRAVGEAKWLKSNHSVDKMTRAKSVVPDLWLILMGEEGSATQKVYTFGERLSIMYKRSTAQENLQEFIDMMEKNYKYELMWASSEQRFDTVVQGIRAKAMMEAMSNPNWLRADTLYHRRSQDLLQTLVNLKHENSPKTQQVLHVIEPLNKVVKTDRKSKRIKGVQTEVQDA